MIREEAREILTHNWTRVDNPNYSESELDEAFFMAIEALQREEAEEKGYCHRIKPKEYFENDATNRAEQKLREMPRYLNGVKEKQITKISADDEPKPKWNCTANFVAEQLERLKDMTDEERVKLLQTLFPSADAVHGEWIIRDDMPKLDNTYSIECSECGQLMFGHYNADNPNFCCNCGTKMDGERREL